jgi:glycosyltransferase involved in cell wall biosynthesis
MPFDPSPTSRRDRRVGILSTYPPQRCGLATFAASLEHELVDAGDDVTVVAIDDGRGNGSLRSKAHFELINGLPSSVRDTAKILSRGDVAIVQHEYGIYGGVDGDEVLDVLQQLEVPAIVVLHTVPSHPTANQQRILEAVCELAAAVVVMTNAARSRLTINYAVDAERVTMIPHGAWSLPAARGADRARVTDHPRLLTWGLLGPGKGIEHVIRAMTLVDDLRPRVQYSVAGATHPKVFARDGDHYRLSLIRTAWATGVAGSIHFDDSYRDSEALMRFVRSASVVVLPYDSPDQVTSGVLVDAIAAGRPVIATAFPHAVELLSDGAGIIVPHREPVALAAAIRTALCEPGVLEAMTTRARELAPSLGWPTVAAQYRALTETVTSTAVAAAT